MKTIHTLILVIILFALDSKQSFGQSLIINASLIDGVEITRDNIYSYQIISSLKNTVNAQITGTISYRGSDLRMSYTLNLNLTPGNNILDINSIHPVWTYSQNALKELFLNYNTLPAGTYQYCIQVIPKNIVGETDPGNVIEECIYHKSQELFLINLIEPENNAKIYEHNPILTWIANYSFANELTYKIRVAEIKKGQNTENAITRNNPIYQEANLRQNTLSYPMTAKELEVYQPYAWTVDAYYKGILLGGAEPWRFTIIEDSLDLSLIPKDQSYYEFQNHYGESPVFAIGSIKLKYYSNKSNELLTPSINIGDKVKLFKELNSYLGDNLYTIDLMPYNLKHSKKYSLNIKESGGKLYVVSFIYINPEFLN